MKGRDARFFDVEIGEPQFASLLITIKSASFDEHGLRSQKRTRNLIPQELVQDSLKKGAALWSSLESTSSLAMKGELNKENAGEYHDLLGQMIHILPSEENDLDRLDVTFQGKLSGGTVTIDKRTGDRLIRAQQFGGSSICTLTGSIIEVNGEAKTFIIKTGDRLTTCAPTSEIFDLMDENDLLRRGQGLRIYGSLWRRKRRDYISFDKYPEVL